MEFRRYALYYAPEPGGFADAASRWLGWDAALGQAVDQPVLPVPLRDRTAEPRRYGFHGTLKAPFRLQAGIGMDDLSAGIQTLVGRLGPVEMPGLDLVKLGRFLALVPGESPGLVALAERVVTGLDPFRAPLNAGEVARRRPERLTDRQRALLDLYGYPFVMEEFRFHLTLSGPLDTADLQALLPLAKAHFAPHLPRPFRVADLCLFGEGDDGFHLLHRFPLTG